MLVPYLKKRPKFDYLLSLSLNSRLRFIFSQKKSSMDSLTMVLRIVFCLFVSMVTSRAAPFNRSRIDTDQVISRLLPFAIVPDYNKYLKPRVDAFFFILFLLLPQNDVELKSVVKRWMVDNQANTHSLAEGNVDEFFKEVGFRYS